MRPAPARFAASLAGERILNDRILKNRPAKKLRVPAPAARQGVLLAAVPAGFFGTVFGARFGVASVEASSTLIASTLFSIVTLSLVIYLTAGM